MVPLIVLQDRAGSDADSPSLSGVATSMNISMSAVSAVSRGGGRGTDEAGPPANLMAYPPLAYLANALLCVLNFLRECPLTVVRDDVLSELKWLFDHVCVYLVERAQDIRFRSLRFLDENKGKLKRHLETTASSIHLDRLYAMALETELIPHILLCFESIFPAAGSIKAVGKTPLPPDQTSSELQSRLCPVSLNIILTSRDILRKGQLID